MTSAPSRAQIISRTAAALLGGYAFVWGFASLTTVLGASDGLSYGDARTLAFLLAFLVYLTCFLWAFSASRMALVWAVLGGGGALMTGTALLVLRARS